jgi:hypothetical protein
MLVDLVREDFGISGHGKWWRSDTHSSLVVDAESDVFYFNSRGLRGGPVDYLHLVRGVKKSVAHELVNRNLAMGIPLDKETSLQTKFEKLVQIFHNNGKSKRDYWREKGIEDSTVDRYRLGFYEGWYLIPIYRDSVFVNFQCRRSEPKKFVKFWYKDPDFRPVLFNSGVLPFVRSVYIVEGMVDCLMLNQKGLPCVCSTNGNMSWDSNWVRYFSNINEIVYVTDNDSAGINGAIRTAKMLGEGRVKILRYKDRAEGFGALDFFLEGNSVDDFKDVVARESVYAFEKEAV